MKQTCPDIDEQIRLNNNVISDLKVVLNVHDDTFRFEISEAIDRLNEVNDFLHKDMRQANHSLREWGHECEEEIKLLNNTITKLEERLDNGL